MDVEFKTSLRLDSGERTQRQALVGVSSDVLSRVWTHKSDVLDGFTKRYGVHRLVYVEFHDTMEQAIVREKQIKKWRRAWKLKMIEEHNPQWRDLYHDLIL